MKNHNLIKRNIPIIQQNIQEEIATKKVLFAGCGLGSCIAESFVRLGVNYFNLVDNDIIEEHNLNRQSFEVKDIGEQKVYALTKRIVSINPQAVVFASDKLVDADNAKELIAQSDIVIDTIDFLDLSAIIALHDEAQRQSKPVISLFTAGWGAIGIFVPPGKVGDSWAREIFNVKGKEFSQMSYKQSFMAFFQKISTKLNPDVAVFMKDVFDKMLDNKPCPAPNVIAGAQSAAIIAQKLFVEYLQGKVNIQAPDFVYLDLERIFSNSKLRVF